jgi:hypothetical protein
MRVGASRSRRTALAVAAALSAALAAPPVVLAQPDRAGVVTPDTPFTWSGAVATGHNETYDPAAGGPCGKSVATFCDVTLVEVRAGDFFATSGGGVEFSIGGSRGNDLDLFVYASDASGARGELVGVSGGPTDEERVSVQRANGFYLLHVVYFDVTNAGYAGRAEFFRRALVPPDVDAPAGLQDHLASNPGLGSRSHSESIEATAGPTSGRSTSARRRRRRRPRGRWATPAIRPMIRTARAPGPRTPPARGRAATSASSTSPPTHGSTSTTRATPTRWCSTRRSSRAARAGA